MDQLDLKSLFLDKLLGDKSAPPPPYQYGPDRGPPDVDPYGNGPAPSQDWTPPEANQPGWVDRGANAAKRFMRDAPGMVPDMPNMPSAPNMDAALKAAEEAFNKVMQGGRDAAQAAEGAGRDLWDRFNPPTLQRPQPGQSPTYPGPDRSGPPFLERPQPGQSPTYTPPPEPQLPPERYQDAPDFFEDKRRNRRWET